jgi:hypothetical protein
MPCSLVEAYSFEEMNYKLFQFQFCLENMETELMHEGMHLIYFICPAGQNFILLTLGSRNRRFGSVDIKADHWTSLTNTT